MWYITYRGICSMWYAPTQHTATNVIEANEHKIRLRGSTTGKGT